MKKFTGILSLLLALIMLFSAFTACTPTETPEDDTTVGEEITGDIQQTREVFEIITNGTPNVRIVRPADYTTDHPAVQAAIKLRSEINDHLTGAEVTIGDDWIMPGTTHDSEALEILVGYTSYPESAAVIADISYGDYAIRAVGNKIIVFGYSDKAISSATTQLCNIIRNSAKDGETSGTKTVAIDASLLSISGTHNKALSALPAYEGTEFSSYYDPGNDCHEIILEKADTEDYAAYINKLQDKGYTKYTDNDMNGNLFTTLYNDKYTLNVGFYKHTNQARIVVEPFSETTLIGLEKDNVYEKVTTTQITMVGCEYQKGTSSSGAPEYAGNGLIMIIRLCDGRFVIIDAGFNTTACANAIFNTLISQSKDYTNSLSDITIAAWIITHSHGDHYGAFSGKTATFKDLTVERVILNFLSETERAKAISTYPDNWSSGEGGGSPAVITAAKGLGAEVVVAHVGQRFYFADTVFEVLYTHESYGPSVANALNTTSLVIQATTTDPATGKSTKTMITGDATGPAFAICNAMYGNYMKSDIVQVAHHGYGTWGQSASTATAYVFMAPTTVLWPMGLNAYPNYVNKDYNKTLHDESNPNWKETYVAGWVGSTTTVPLPYTYGTDRVVQNLKTQN